MKQTVEEAAMNFANYESNNLDKLPFKVKNVVDYDNGLTRGFKAGAEWQVKQSPWISVEDAIPNKQAKGMCQVKFVDGSIDEMAMREVNKMDIPLHQDWICYSLDTYSLFRRDTRSQQGCTGTD